jgi:hypothetical protein
MSDRFRRVVRLAVNTVLDFMFTGGEHGVMSITPTELQVRAGISKGYASDLLAGNKTPSPAKALHIMRTTGLKLGPIANLTDDEIALLEKMHG